VVRKVFKLALPGRRQGAPESHEAPSTALPAAA
jgi:hypothetical protein